MTPRVQAQHLCLKLCLCRRNTYFPCRRTACLSFPSHMGQLSSLAGPGMSCSAHHILAAPSSSPGLLTRDPQAVEITQFSFSFQAQATAQTPSAFPAELLLLQVLLHTKTNCPWQSRVLQASRSPRPNTTAISLLYLSLSLHCAFALQVSHPQRPQLSKFFPCAQQQSCVFWGVESMKDLL